MGEVDFHFKPSVSVFDANMALGRRQDRRVNVGSVEETLEAIRRWTGLYGGEWDGVVAAPRPGLGSEIIVTAWRRVLRLDPFDAPGAAAFIDRYRGRGPENAVR